MSSEDGRDGSLRTGAREAKSLPKSPFAAADGLSALCPSPKARRPLKNSGFRIESGYCRSGGLAGTRTQDQRLKRPLLYRLSYQPGTATERPFVGPSNCGIEPARNPQAKSKARRKLIQPAPVVQGFSRAFLASPTPRVSLLRGRPACRKTWVLRTLYFPLTTRRDGCISLLSDGAIPGVWPDDRDSVKRA